MESYTNYKGRVTSVFFSEMSTYLHGLNQFIPKMKNYLIKIAVGLLLIYAGWKITDSGDQRISQEDFNAKQEHCKNASTTAGFLRDSAQEITMKIGKIKSKMYEYQYDYFVNGQKYVVKNTTNITTPPDSVTVWYHQGDVANASTTNPCRELETYMKEKTIGSKMWFYILGIPMILIGLGLAWGNFKEMIVTAVRGKKK